jgi:Xaa-Pro dipeptidase
MSHNRRKFLSLTALSAGAMTLSGSVFGKNANNNDSDYDLPKSIRDLQPAKEGIVPITIEERKQRIQNAQAMMDREKIDAIFLEGTTSCYYFTGMRWGQSERTFGLVIPAKGAIAYVCPKFEEDRARELLLPVFGDEVRCWEEHESPYAVIVAIVKDRGVKHRKIGMEERVRFFIADGVKKVATGFEIVDATPITAGCRMIKTKAELALMQKSSDITILAYQAAFPTIRDGMSQTEFSNNISAAFRKLGYSGGASVQIGKYSALPHGSITPQTIREGDVVMVDGGTSCEGCLLYTSDAADEMD